MTTLVGTLWSAETLILNLFCPRKYFKNYPQNQSLSYLLQIFAPINNRHPQPETYEEIKQTAVVRIQVNDDRVNASNLNEGKKRKSNNLSTTNPELWTYHFLKRAANCLFGAK